MNNVHHCKCNCKTVLESLYDVLFQCRNRKKVTCVNDLATEALKRRETVCRKKNEEKKWVTRVIHAKNFSLKFLLHRNTKLNAESWSCVFTGLVFSDSNYLASIIRGLWYIYFLLHDFGINLIYFCIRTIRVEIWRFWNFNLFLFDLFVCSSRILQLVRATKIEERDPPSSYVPKSIHCQVRPIEWHNFQQLGILRVPSEFSCWLRDQGETFGPASLC